MVIRADRVRERGRLVEPIGKRDRQRHRRQAAGKPRRVRHVVRRIHAVEQQAVNLATLHLVDQLRQRAVVALLLEGRRLEVDRGAEVAEQGVDRMHHDLRRRVLRSADHQRRAAMPPEIRGRRGHGPLVDRAIDVPGADLDARRDRGRAGRDAGLHTRRDRDSTQDRERDGALLGCRDRHAVVGVGAGQRDAGLELIVTRHHPGGVGPPPPRVLPRELDGREPGAEEVGPDPHDRGRAIEAIVRQAVDREAGAGRPPQRAERHRVVNDVAEGRHAGLPLGDERAGRRAHDRARQQDEIVASGHRRPQPLLDARVHVLPRHRHAEPRRPFEPLRVVERQDGRLPGRARAAAGKRRFGVAFDLDRPPVARFHQHSAAGRAGAARRRVPGGDAGHRFLGLDQERNRLLDRASRAARERRGGEHEPHARQKVAPAGLEVRAVRAAGRALLAAGLDVHAVLPECQVVRHLSNDTFRNRGWPPAYAGR